MFLFNFNLFLALSSSFSYLNTTFVSLQQIKLFFASCSLNYLNTTFVSLQQSVVSCLFNTSSSFKYNFCFSSTVVVLSKEEANRNLNTTFVSLQREEYNEKFIKQLFKYNFCFSSTTLFYTFAFEVFLFKYNFCFSSTLCWRSCKGNELNI